MTITAPMLKVLRALAAGTDMRHPTAGTVATRDALYARGLIGKTTRTPRDAAAARVPAEVRDPSRERWTVEVTPAGRALLANV